VRGIRIVVVRDLAKVEARVRFPYPAPELIIYSSSPGFPVPIFHFANGALDGNILAAKPIEQISNLNWTRALGLPRVNVQLGRSGPSSV
jgi:hypothetical protein